ncbi:MAG TPA: hypothetical protein VF916_02095, partial [Ktedonobacterales bacterium]
MADMDEFEQLDDLNSEIRRLRRAGQETRDRLVRALSREEVEARYKEVEEEDLWGYEPIAVRIRHVIHTQGRNTPGSKTEDYLALNYGNDPYYVGTRKDWTVA